MDEHQRLMFDDPESTVRRRALNVVRANAESVAAFDLSYFAGYRSMKALTYTTSIPMIADLVAQRESRSKGGRQFPTTVIGCREPVSGRSLQGRLAQLDRRRDPQSLNVAPRIESSKHAEVGPPPSNNKPILQRQSRLQNTQRHERGKVLQA